MAEVQVHGATRCTTMPESLGCGWPWVTAESHADAACRCAPCGMADVEQHLASSLAAHGGLRPRARCAAVSVSCWWVRSSAAASSLRGGGPMR